VEGGELTPSLKLKRSVVRKEFAGDIERLYT
jgi:long-chain acyl-CoA synthetase